MPFNCVEEISGVSHNTLDVRSCAVREFLSGSNELLGFCIPICPRVCRNVNLICFLDRQPIKILMDRQTFLIGQFRAFNTLWISQASIWVGHQTIAAYLVGSTLRGSAHHTCIPYPIASCHSVPRLSEEVVGTDLHHTAFFILEAQVVRARIGRFITKCKVPGDPDIRVVW